MVLEVGAQVERYLPLERLSPFPAPERPVRTLAALDLDRAERVALQVARGTPVALEEFTRNLKRARGYAFPYMPPLLAGGVTDDQAYVATSWIPGVCLADVLRAGPVDIDTAITITWAISAALARLHGRKLVHGDLHPRNVRITLEGKLYLTGFMPDPLAIPQTTCRPEAEVARYAAPEFYQSGARYPAGDVYAVGLILFELLEGRRLLPKAGAEETLRNQGRFQQAMESVARVGKRVPRALDGLLRDMLALDQHRRLQSGAELLEQLMRWWPSASAIKRLEEVLDQLAQRARESASRRAMDAAERHLESQDTLATASALLRLGELELPEGHPRLEAGAQLLQRAMWRALIDGPLPGSQAPAFHLLAHQAARKLGSRVLARLAQAELARHVAGDDPFGRFLARRRGEDQATKELELFRGAVRSDPRDDRALLGLAVRTPDFRPSRGASPAKVKADLLERHDLHAEAILYRAWELQESVDRGTVLLQLADLVERARGDLALAVTDTVPVPRPEAGRGLEELLEHEPESDAGLESEAPPAPGVTSPEEAAALFEQGRALVQGERLQEAAAIFAQLLDAETEGREEHHAALCSQLRDVMWQVLARRPNQAASFELAHALWELARRLHLESLEPLCEGLVLASLPEEGRSELLEEMLLQAPGSIRIRQAAAVEALGAGEKTSWAGHLIAAGREFLARQDLLAASKVLMAAQTVDHSPDLVEARGELIQLGARLAVTAGEYRQLEAEAQAAPDAAGALLAVETFLERHPHYVPAQELEITLAMVAGVPLQATRGVLELAQAAVLREDFTVAKRYLHYLLEQEYENDEALLFLASLDPPEAPEGALAGELRVALLRREGLLEVAKHHARSMLTGGPEDVRVHETLAELCIESGHDPSPHLLSLVHHALRSGDEHTARIRLADALHHGQDKAALVAQVLESPELGALVPKAELMKAMAPEEGAGSP